MQNQKAIQLHDIPDDQIRNYYASAFQQGRALQAFIICCEAINRTPDDSLHILSMSTIIRAVQVQNIAPPMKTAIQSCLEKTYIARQSFAHIWQQIILKDEIYAPLRTLTGSKDYESFCENFDISTLKPCLDDPFLLIGLKTLLITNIDIEKFLTYMRRYLLEHHATRQAEIPLDFLSALAQLCFFNEYVFACNETEKQAVNALKEQIETGDATAFLLGLYGCYAPLYTLSNAAKHEKSETLKSIVNQQITAPFRENKIKGSIPPIKPISDETSNAVQTMYEENPYPRWDSITVHQDICDNITGEHLIAGCGTGKPTTQFALKFPDMNVTALDLSLSSIAYAKRKSDEFGAKNINFFHGDLMDLGSLGQKFDSIDCSGVLHHMKDPIAGWKNLINVLKPGGRMNIGLYSTKARASIFAARDLIAEHGLESNANGIRDFRKIICDLPDNHPAKQVCMRPDFYSTSQCRDLTFHIQEETYTLLKIEEILDNLDLEFEGFWLGLPKFEAVYAQNFPNDPQMRNLKNWDALEQQYPNMFAAMYQFVCCRKSEANLTNQTWESIKNSGLFRLSGSKKA